MVGKYYCNLLARAIKVDKQLFETRWSARTVAVICLHDSYEEIKKGLESLINYFSQTKETQNDIQNLIKKKLDIFGKIFSVIFKEMSKIFKKEKLKLDVAVRILKSL